MRRLMQAEATHCFARTVCATVSESSVERAVKRGCVSQGTLCAEVSALQQASPDSVSQRRVNPSRLYIRRFGAAIHPA
jgi:hypothetical protein